MKKNMNEPWLILDGNYLAHRAKYVFGKLEFEGNATGVVYGFLKDIRNFQTQFKTQKLVFCWDSHHSYRKQMYPSYKINRTLQDGIKSPEERIFDLDFRRQIAQLRHKYLGMIGWTNNFLQEGYESDDLIASICHSIPEGIIITADKDLYQCITGTISCYNPQTRNRMTLQSFYESYNIEPSKWALVKCLAGCSSDCVEGIHGVGETTAIKFIRGILNPNTKAYKRIIKNRQKFLQQNRPLVKLPFEGTIQPDLHSCSFNKEGWQEVCALLGMKSLRD